jgi:hypothetical protein
MIEWLAAKLSASSETTNDQSDTLEYCLQLQNVKKDIDYKDIYRGEDLSFHLNDLEANTEYYIRLCAIRVTHSTEATSSQQQVKRICSAFTSHVMFTTKSYSKTNLLRTKQEEEKINHIIKPTFLSRFILPSFYQNFNSSVDNMSLKYNNDVLASTSQQKSVKKQNILINTGRRKSSVQNESNSLHLSSSANNSNQRVSDQQWALIFILAIVFFAFLIAFIANSIYSSYNKEHMVEL